MRTRKLLTATVTLLVAALAVFAACSSEDRATPTPEGEGTVSGTIEIGPLCPVEPCTNPLNPYTGLQAVVRTDDDEIAVIDVDGSGAFSGVVPAGEYLVEIRPCDYLGCRGTLPVRITVRDGQTSTMELRIDTGIR